MLYTVRDDDQSLLFWFQRKGFGVLGAIGTAHDVYEEIKNRGN